MKSGTPRDKGVHSDEEIVAEGLAHRPGIQFEKLLRTIYSNHAFAHLYIGGNIGGFGMGDVGQSSFEDPFVFLLYSNVDRLWASWQLSHRGFNAWEKPTWCVEPHWSYGQLIYDRLEEAALARRRGEGDAERRYCRPSGTGSGDGLTAESAAAQVNLKRGKSLLATTRLSTSSRRWRCSLGPRSGPEAI